MMGYLQKCRGRQFHRADGASWKEADLLESFFPDNKKLVMCEQLWFFGRRAHSMFATRRTGVAVKRANLAEAMHRIITGQLKYMAPFLNVLQKIRLMVVCDTLQKIRPHDDFAMDNMNTINPEVLQVMDLWARTDDRDLAEVVTIAEINTVFFRGKASKENVVVPQDTPGNSQFGHAFVNWDTVSYDAAVGHNAQVAEAINDELAASRAGSFSKNHMSIEALQSRVEAERTIVEGGSSYFPTVGNPNTMPEDEQRIAAEIRQNEQALQDAIPLPRRLYFNFVDKYLNQALPWASQFSGPRQGTVQLPRCCRRQ